MFSSISTLCYLGCEYTSTNTERRKIYNTNLTAIIAIISISFFGLIDLATGNSALLKIPLAYIPFYLIFVFTLWLNHKGKVSFARWLFSLSLFANVCTVAFVAQGSFLDVHFYFILFGLVPVMFFPLAQWKSILFLFTLNLSAYIFCEKIGLLPDPAIYELEPFMVVVLRLLHEGISLSTLMLIVLLSEHVAGKNEAKLEALSSTDSLTGLCNRRGFEQHFKLALFRCKRFGGYGTLLFIDLDNFKPLNDKHGHDAGDVVLKEIAQHIKGCVRSIDIVARFGGDEFVALLEFYGNNKQDATNGSMIVAEKIRAAISREYEIIQPNNTTEQAVTFTCSCSIGISFFSGISNWMEVFKQADHAMYMAKQGGRNSVRVFETA